MHSHGISHKLVSEELRAVEHEIDSYHVANPLMHQQFARAGWYFLAICEELAVHRIIRNDTSSVHEHAAFADNLLVHAKWPLQWLKQVCLPGGTIPRAYDDEMYAAAWQLSELAMQYLPFESAFRYATFGLATLALDGNRIQSSSPMRNDVRFEAYDRLIEHNIAPPPVELLDNLFLEQVDASVRLHDASFSYDLNPQVVKSGLEALATTIDDRFALPPDWKFPRFTLKQFRQVARVLWVLAFIHFRARLVAVMQGCQGLGISKALLLMENGEMLRRVRRYSGVSDDAVAAILDILTYGAGDQSNPDPALQPIIPLTSSTVAISPSLVLNNSMERNLSVLLNRLSEERSAYSVLSRDREVTMRTHLIERLSGMRLRFWHGKIPQWDAASEIDLAIISDEERQCLILELKSFIAPAEPREIRERSEEIQTGVKQVKNRMEMAQTLPEPFRRRLGIDGSYRLTWAVASETSIGAAYVQSADVPVLNAQHLVSRLRQDARLAACCHWLEDRAYLPIEGTDYEVVPVEAHIGEWTLEWYSIRGLTQNYIQRA